MNGSYNGEGFFTGHFLSIPQDLYSNYNFQSTLSY